MFALRKFYKEDDRHYNVEVGVFDKNHSMSAENLEEGALYQIYPADPAKTFYSLCPGEALLLQDEDKQVLGMTQANDVYIHFSVTRKCKKINLVIVATNGP